MSLYEDYTKTSLSYDVGGRIPLCVPEILAQIPDGCAVLDAGCGTGNYFLPLVQSGKLAKYTGFDVNEGMLAKTKAKVQLLKKSGNSTEIAIKMVSLLDLPLPFQNQEFDVILHNEVMHHVTSPDDKDKFKNVRPYLAEFYRILKPGGFITINLFTHEQQEAMWFSGGIPSVIKNVKARFPDGCEVEELLQQAGFKDLTSHTDHKPSLGENLFAYEKCFTKEYREASSEWKLADEKDLEEFLKKMKVILSDKERRRIFDEKVRGDLAAAGQSTQIFAWK